MKLKNIDAMSEDELKLYNEELRQEQNKIRDLRKQVKFASHKTILLKKKSELTADLEAVTQIIEGTGGIKSEEDVPGY